MTAPPRRRTNRAPAAFALALGALLPPAQAADPPESLVVTVQPGARQVFAGLGVSLGNWGGDYQKLTPAERDRLASLLFDGLRLRSLRLWVNLDEYAPAPGRREPGDFRRRYVESGLIADARRHGVVDLLLAPDGMPPHLKAKRAGGPADFALRDDAVGPYAALVAEFLARLRDEAGVTLDATGIQNEPNDLDRIAPAQMPRLVVALRRELDRRGLRSVRIIAPEAANVDSTFHDAAAALAADPAAWSALDGLASHSYGMAATEDAARRVAGPGGIGNAKSYWMTEASDNGPEGPGDATRAASLAGRFLNDVNHRATHWVHFLGFEVPDPNDDATRILAYTPRPLRVAFFQKYYYYRQLAATFDPGATFRASTSSAEGDMTWTYGRKPRLTVAAARNPDGTWGVGAVDFTSAAFRDDPAAPNSSSNGHPARSFRLTVRVEELAGSGVVPCSIRRSGPHLTDADEGTIELVDGVATVDLGPLELVTLRTRPATTPKDPPR